MHQLGRNIIPGIIDFADFLLALVFFANLLASVFFAVFLVVVFVFLALTIY